MARYTGAGCRLCRREGVKLFLKSDRCYKDKCALDRRATVPGQHSQNKGKSTSYGIQLREKQKLRRFYGLMERQFVKSFKEAARRKGVTGKTLLEIMERRLDNVVYRLGFALTRNQARQLVTHGHIMVNDQKVDIASYQVKVNDTIKISEKSKDLVIFVASMKFAQRMKFPTWLEVDSDKLTGKVLGIPTRDEVSLPIQEKLIVELYS
ncbi:30S ribosomal protein S4 [Candidatus Poribacteria bacterium]|nr:30S ribosomal protein S4 [Candidatus Poribacteria bacterium]